MKPVEVFYDGRWVGGERLRKGPNNSRVKFWPSEIPKEDLFKNEDVREVEPAAAAFDFARIVPVTPLRSLYRHLRNVEGGGGMVLQAIETRLSPAEGLSSAVFLGHLFQLSVERFRGYRNVGEAFIPPSTNRVRDAARTGFAREVVERWRRDDPVVEGYRHVEYEVSPYRTTRSCFEDGSSASTSGQGGIDLLLCNRAHEPVVMEIKAATETVGPMFALIQALMYAAELATVNQLARLHKHHGGFFREADRVEILLLIEREDNPAEGRAKSTRMKEELDATRVLAQALMTQPGVKGHLSGINVWEAAWNGDRVRVVGADS